MEGYGRLDHCTIRDEGEFSIRDHGAGEVFHHWCRLDVDVLEHSVTAPTSHELDAVVVNVGT